VVVVDEDRLAGEFEMRVRVTAAIPPAAPRERLLPRDQAIKAGIEFEPLDNGFRACDQAEPVAGICDSLSEQDIQQYLNRWLRVLPSPFAAAERSRYRYRLSVRQIEVSDTRVFDRPAAGRAWFEHTIRDQLDLGRPDKVQIIFNRKITRRTPGRFQTKVITKGVEPVIQAHYKHSEVKQYFKEGRALRTETTVNDPYDFGMNAPSPPTPGSNYTRSAMASTTGSPTPSFRRAPARRTPRPSSFWCRQPSRMANRARPALRRPQGDGSVRVPVLVPAPIRRPD
jgi:hypothetical protein